MQLYMDKLCDNVVTLPNFPVKHSETVNEMNRLSSLTRLYPDYREPFCLAGRLMFENASSYDPLSIISLLQKGISITEKKPGLPVDLWCWGGGPEKLISRLLSSSRDGGNDIFIVT